MPKLLATSLPAGKPENTEAISDDAEFRIELRSLPMSLIMPLRTLLEVLVGSQTLGAGVIKGFSGTRAIRFVGAGEADTYESTAKRTAGS